MELSYSLKHSTATVSLAVTDERFIAETQGRGALDKLRTINIPLPGLKNFFLSPVIGVQNLHNFRNDGDFSYDSEFIFSYHEGKKIKTKRVFVNSRDAAFELFLNELKRKRPDANLLHLSPEEAMKQTGVLSAGKAMRIILWLLVGVPVTIALIFIIYKIVRG